MNEHFAIINFQGEQIKATRLNTSLDQHFGRGALYDHIWVHKDDSNAGGYIWKEQPPDNPAYTLLAPAVVDNNCEMHLNVQKAAECDLKAFGKAALADSQDYFPESWVL